MFSISNFRNALFLSLPLLSQVSSAPTQDDTLESKSIFPWPEPKEAFKALLDKLPEESLHSALQDHLYPKYQNGIFEFDRTAVESVHHENPPLATKVMSAAMRLELAKRQAGGNETASSIPVEPSAAATSTQAISSTQSESPTPPPQPTSTIAPSSPQTSEQPPPTTSAPPPPQPSSSTSQSDEGVLVTVTRTDSSGNTITSEQLQPGAIVTSVNSQGSTVVMTTPKPVTPSAITSVDQQGSTFVSTFTPSASRVTKVVTRLTTNSVGVTETIIETATLDSFDSGPTGVEEEPAPSSTEPPDLVTGHANVNGQSWVAVVMGGIVGIVAWVL